VVISMIPTFTSPKEFEKKEENELEEILKWNENIKNIQGQKGHLRRQE
jgi:hypothetical protein